jgi:hypothetical protein
MMDPEQQEAILQRADHWIQGYLADHPAADTDELVRYLGLLEASLPGLKEARLQQQAEAITTALLLCGMGDDWPRMGPGAQPLPTGETTFVFREHWSLEDFRLNIAWWWHYPDPRHAVAQRLLAEAAQHWPDEDFTSPTWPDTSALPRWTDIAPHVEILTADLTAYDDEDEEPPEA